MKSIEEQFKAHEAAQLMKLIEWAGSQRMLGHILGVSPQVVSNWVKRGRISATKAAELEKLTKGEFKKSDLRPDVKEWYL